MAGKIPAITLYQPHASLAAIGAKPLETRDWPAPVKYIGGRIAIHAGSSPKYLRHFFGGHPVGTATRSIRAALGAAHMVAHLLPKGAVIATATLLGCYHVAEYDETRRLAFVDRWAAGSRPPLPKQGVGGRWPFCTDDFGDYTPGRWLWRLTDVRRIEPPIAARGFQRVWGWEDPR